MVKDPIVAVIGDGSWATALVHLLSENARKVQWWVRNSDRSTYIKQNGCNPSYLSGLVLNTKKVKPITSIRKAIEGSDVVVLATPSAFIIDALKQLPAGSFDRKIVVSAIKGMIPDDNRLITEYVADVFCVPENNLAVIAGPCHAEEIALGKQSYLTVACTDEQHASFIASLLKGKFVMVNCLSDVIGIEYSAIMKNIIAIASGITHTLNFGDNFQAVLVSNAMQEIRTFIERIHPLKNRDVNGSAYLGDLLVTSYSQFSRNRMLGTMVARGYSVKSAIIEMKMIPEGYYAIKCIQDLSKKHSIDMPICTAVYHMLYERVSPAIEVQILKSKLK